MPPTLAPAVAVVGPARSGKTTLLHLLDQALQLHPAAPLVHVVHGNPDGTGRYLLHAPELRETLKQRVKGIWCSETIETVCQWVDACRRRLALVLVDFGGRHAPSNPAMLRHCSHSLVLARTLDDPNQEAEEGMESWVRVCHECGLEPLARVRSLWQQGEAGLSGRAADGALEATFRADASSPGDPSHQQVVAALVEALLALRVDRPEPSYLDLRLAGRDWALADLEELAGLRPRLEGIVRGGGPLVLGGRAPIWAYAAALHRALDLDPTVAIEVFDPKLPAGLVGIPERLEATGDSPLSLSVQVGWRQAEADAVARLEIAITTPDKLLPPAAAEHLDTLPRPAAEPPAETVVADGAAPIWLHLACSRWLRSLPGVKAVAVWDARSRSAVRVHTRSAAAPPRPLHLFLRCGDAYLPPADGGPWQVLTLPEILGPEAIAGTVGRVRRALRGHRAVRLLIAGPVALGVALGQALAHEPIAVDYLQLNQSTKELEVWVTNRRNL